MHDLWHVVTGYGRDDREACLLAFTYACISIRGVGFIAFVGCFKPPQSTDSSMCAQVVILARLLHWQGRWVWLPDRTWESLSQELVWNMFEIC